MSTGGRRVALIVAYTGTGFAGFARQPAQRTVQAVLEEALGQLAGAPVRVRGAGRTDAGVHALGQVCDLCLPEGVRIPTQRLPPALAQRLPPDVAAVSAHEVPAGFHARIWASGKRYRYLLWRAAGRPPLWRPYAWHYAGPLDVPAMREAAAHLEGRRDFRCFAGSARPVADAVRTIFECAVRAEGPWLAIDVAADGFLYRMARAIAGTLLQVGRGALPPAAVPGLIAARRRAGAGPSLPAHGLCLLQVRYPPGRGPAPAPVAAVFPP